MILNMKRLELVCLKEDKDKLLKLFQKSGSVMFVDPIKVKSVSVEKTKVSSQECDKIKNILAKLEKLENQRGISNSNEEAQPQITADDILNSNEEYFQLKKDISQCFHRIENIKLVQEANDKEIEKLKPWQYLDFPIKELKNNAYVEFFTILVSKSNISEIAEKLTAYKIDFEPSPLKTENVALLIICCKSDAGSIESLLKGYSHTKVSFNEIKNPETTILEEINRLNEYSKYLSKQLKLEYNKLEEFSRKAGNLKILYEQITAKNTRENTSCVETAQAVYLEAWIKAKDEHKINSILEKSNIPCDIEIFDPTDEDIVPTVTENKSFVKPFEIITNMFSIPSHKEIDPNPIMAFWYWLIFGMMVGDAGYGVLMLLIGTVCKKLLNPKGSVKQILNILILSSISTIFWGIMFGSYFSIESSSIKPILFSPLNNSMEMMKLSLLIGVVHISSGLIFKAVELIKNRKILDAICDQISWVFVINGICIAGFLPQIGLWMSIIGVATIVIMGGRKKKNIFGKITGGVSSLYGITSYLSDILSYSRILALGLATCVVAMVMNTLASMLPKTIIGIIFSVLVYIVGHVFNLVLGLLSAYVHDSRLQYIEFFNKFYNGGGKEFVPLAIQTNYMELKE